MSSAKMYILGALTVLLCFGAFQMAAPARAVGNGPYVLMHHSNTAANAGVFRLDTNSGAVSYCFIGTNNDLICSREIK